MENTLLHSILNRKIDNIKSLWRLKDNFGFKNIEEIYQYCIENHIHIAYKDDYDIQFKIDLQEYFDNKLKNKIFSETAVLNDGKWKSFGINKLTADLYGHKKEDIKAIGLKLINTSFSDPHTIDEENKKFYYGFYKFTENKVLFIFDTWMKMCMCFPDLSRSFENSLEGIPVKIQII